MEQSEQTLEEALEAQARLLRRLIDPTRQRAIINLDGARLCCRAAALHRPSAENISEQAHHSAFDQHGSEVAQTVFRWQAQWQRE